MSSVLTLIADPAARTLSPAMVDLARECLGDSGAVTNAPDWLERAVACDVGFDRLSAAQAEGALRQAFEDFPIDLLVQPAAGRRKALLVADMESTIIGQEMLDELAAHCGLGPGIAEITTRAMAGELDFEASLKARVRLLEGLPVRVLDEVSGLMTPNPGALALVTTMRSHGAYCALVSGGFDIFTARVREICGFDEDRANHLLLRDGHISGQLAEPVLGRAAKLDALIALCARYSIGPDRACAVGDGANDLDMVRVAGLGVAYRGKPVLRTSAKVRVEHADLTALLYMQGYRGSEINRPEDKSMFRSYRAI